MRSRARAGRDGGRDDYRLVQSFDELGAGHDRSDPWRGRHCLESDHHQPEHGHGDHRRQPTAPVGGNSVIMITGASIVSGTGFSVTPSAALDLQCRAGCRLQCECDFIADYCGVSGGTGTPYVVGATADRDAEYRRRGHALAAGRNHGQLRPRRQYRSAHG